MKTIEDILSHFGTKGMKWGVRKSSPSASVPASDDATRATAIRKKVKAGGTKALSNKELQDAITRINLEQQFSKLNPTKAKRATQVISEILGVGNTVNQVLSFVNSPAGKLIKDGLTSK